MIDVREDFEPSDYNVLINASELSSYIVFYIHVLKKVKNYSRCLSLFLQNNNTLLNQMNFDLFDWINNTLKELEESDNYHFEQLKKEVMKDLTKLSEISIDKVTLLVENWFHNEQFKIITQLNKVKPLQLKYVETVLIKYKEEIEYYMTHDNYDANSETMFNNYIEILKLHIKLLCKLQPNNVI
jgi:hypothetical protein